MIYASMSPILEMEGSTWQNKNVLMSGWSWTAFHAVSLIKLTKKCCLAVILTTSCLYFYACRYVVPEIRILSFKGFIVSRYSIFSLFVCFLLCVSLSTIVCVCVCFHFFKFLSQFHFILFSSFSPL